MCPTSHETTAVRAGLEKRDRVELKSTAPKAVQTARNRREINNSIDLAVRAEVPSPVGALSSHITWDFVLGGAHCMWREQQLLMLPWFSGACKNQFDMVSAMVVLRKGPSIESSTPIIHLEPVRYLLN